MGYRRVLPHDLFNEANLLKCLGQLALKIRDAGLPIRVEHDGAGFDVERVESSGETYCTSLAFFVGGDVVDFYCPPNSRRPYPLTYFYSDQPDDWDGCVFTDDGEFTDDFDTLVGVLVERQIHPPSHTEQRP